MMDYEHKVTLFVQFKDAEQTQERVKEYVIMPSGDIVVRVESGESLWFNSKGEHPKSRLWLLSEQGCENDLHLLVPQPRFYVRHPDGSSSLATPQPITEANIIQRIVDRDAKIERLRDAMSSVLKISSDKWTISFLSHVLEETK